MKDERQESEVLYGAIDRFVARHEWAPYVGLIALIVIGCVITAHF